MKRPVSFLVSRPSCRPLPSAETIPVRLRALAVLIGGLAVVSPISVPAAEECSAGSDVIARGRAIAEAECSVCHGLEGRGNEAGLRLRQEFMPVLAGQKLKYLAKAMASYAKGHQWQTDPDSVFPQGMRVDDNMGQIAAGMDRADIDAVSLWYHCQD